MQKEKNVEQTKLESKIEIAANYLSGFVLAYLLYRFAVFPFEWMKNSPFIVTLLFTALSIGRSYAWRRFFATGLHQVVHRFVTSYLK